MREAAKADIYFNDIAELSSAVPSTQIRSSQFFPLEIPILRIVEV